MSQEQPNKPEIMPCRLVNSEPHPSVSVPPASLRVTACPCSVFYTVMKRALDIGVSALFLVLFCWLYVLIALLIKLTSHGPILYVQTRVGAGGRHFPFLKFRSMVKDADDMKAEIEHLNEADGPVFKIKNDPRVTPIGRVLRKFSLDELPQFVNVLLGHMSLVGPRPPLPTEVEKYGEREWKRLTVRPGITCLWQINGRSDVSFDQWMEMDLDYIRRRSLWLDLCILIKTIPAVIACRGAC